MELPVVIFHSERMAGHRRSFVDRSSGYSVSTKHLSMDQRGGATVRRTIACRFHCAKDDRPWRTPCIDIHPVSVQTGRRIDLVRPKTMELCICVTLMAAASCVVGGGFYGKRKANRCDGSRQAVRQSGKSGSYAALSCKEGSAWPNWPSAMTLRRRNRHEKTEQNSLNRCRG